MRLNHQSFWCDIILLFKVCYKNKFNGFNQIAVLRNDLKGSNEITFHA